MNAHNPLASVPFVFSTIYRFMFVSYYPFLTSFIKSHLSVLQLLRTLNKKKMYLPTPISNKQDITTNILFLPFVAKPFNKSLSQNSKHKQQKARHYTKLSH